jgi:hypothetical protein
MRTLSFRVCTTSNTPYLLLLHTAEEPDPLEWRDYVQQMAATISSADALVHAIVATDGGGPNAQQRRELADVVTRGHGSLTHVFTTDMFIRGIVTAFHWIANSRAVAHAPDQFTAVCVDCELSPTDVLAELIHLQKSFPRVLTLEQIIQAIPRAPSKGPHTA